MPGGCQADSEQVAVGKEASSLLGCFGKSIASRPREGTLPVCSAPVSLHPEQCSGLGSPVPETHPGVSPVKSHGDEGIEVLYIQGEAGRAGTIQPAEEEAWKALTRVCNECLMLGEVKMMEADSSC